MHFDYGYFEEGTLGKVYDFGLIKRFSSFVLRYKKQCSVAALITFFTIIFDLIPPYLSKVVVDDYILPSYVLIDISKLSDDTIKKIIDIPNTRKATDQSLIFVNTKDLQNLSRKVHSEILQNNAISNGKYYVIKGKGLENYGYSTLEGEYIISYDSIRNSPQNIISVIRGSDIMSLYVIASLFFLITIISFFLSYKEYTVLEFIAQNVSQDIRNTLTRHVIKQDVKFFEKRPTGKLITRLTNDMENLNEMFKSVFATAIKDIVLVLGVLVILFFLNVRLALFMIIFVPLVLYIAMKFSFMAREAFRELRNTLSRINTFLQERLTGIKIIKILCQEKNQFKLFEDINEKNYIAGIRQIKVFAIFMPVMELLSSIGIAVILYIGGYQILKDHITLGALVAFVSYAQMLFRPVRDLSEKYNIMQAGMASLERIFELLDTDSTEKNGHVFPDNIKGHIIFKNVNFDYGNGNVLKDISFEVLPKRTLAIIGPTGAGKTTIINLIESFYEPTSGSILVDNVDLSDWDKRMLRSHIGLCQQDVFIFTGTLLENITLGRDLTKAHIERALEITGARYLVERLPSGLYSSLGEGGRTLSVGEKQLLAFARAIAGGPEILILDEATSSVDPESERIIQAGLKAMLTSHTAIVIAHRLSTIEEADEILVIKEGRIAEKGDHLTLMQKRGLYYSLRKMLLETG